MAADQNLLFGMLALHNGIVTREQLLDAMNDWMLRKQTPLRDILRARGSLSDDDCHLLDGLVARQLRQHDDDPDKSLASLSLRLSADDQDYLTQVVEELTTGAPMTICSSPAPVVASTGQRYRRVRLFAKGGLGEVYVAMDEELHREVVLKQIQDRLADDPVSRTRFIREAEITGNLEHPGVVPVYGLISDATGRPAYAMRFIHGESFQEAITRFHEADRGPRRDPGERAMALRGLLGRFVAVCNAVGFAHSKGVIHRDLKPANVMLGDYGETLVVDWGLARILNDQHVTEAVPGSLLRLPDGDSSTTRAGEALGTPAYMPPEQASGMNEMVGAASDVFALGATLYAVLTGQAPYTGADALQRARQCRFTPPASVKPDVPRALESVVVKAMAPQPEDRYRSARELAADVERWLADEPVSAHRDALPTRFRRWAKRRRTLVTSVVVLTAATVLLLAGGLWAVRREQARTRAELGRAEHNLDLAKKAVDRFYRMATDDPLFAQGRMRQARSRILEEVLPYYQDFEGQRPDDPELPRQIAEQRFRVAHILDEVGRKQDAVRAYEEAIELHRRLAERLPGDVAAPRRAGEALKLLAVAEAQLGRREEAVRTCEQARDLLRELAARHPDVEACQADLAASWSALGALQDALAQRDRAMASYAEARDLLGPLVRRFPLTARYSESLAGTWSNIGRLHRDRGDRAAALAAYEQARELQQKLVSRHPDNLAYLDELAKTHHNTANALRDAGRPGEALASVRAACDLQRRVVAKDPENATYRVHYGRYLNNLGHLSRGQQPKAALAAFEQARDIQRELYESDTGRPDYADDLARTCTNLGGVQAASGDTGAALESLHEAGKLQRDLAGRYPRVADYALSLGRTLVARAELSARMKHHADAAKDYEEAVALFEKAGRLDPGIRNLAGNVGILRRRIPNALAHAGDYERAAKEVSELARGARLSGAAVVQLAGTLSVCAAAAASDAGRPLPVRERRAEELARQAVGLLRRAAEAGAIRGAEAARLNGDPDLEALRGREDFRDVTRAVAPQRR